MGRAGMCLRGEENRRVRGRVGCARARRVRVGGARRAGVTRTRRRVRHPAEGGQSPLARPPVQPAPRSVTASGAETPTHQRSPGPRPALRATSPPDGPQVRRGTARAPRALRDQVFDMAAHLSSLPRSGGEVAQSAGGAARQRGDPRTDRRFRPAAPDGPLPPCGRTPHLRWGRGCIPGRAPREGCLAESASGSSASRAPYFGRKRLLAGQPLGASLPAAPRLADQSRQSGHSRRRPAASTVVRPSASANTRRSRRPPSR